MLNVFLIVIQVAASLTLIFLILLHSGRGGGLSDMFGGGSLGGSMAGSTVVERNLDRLTVITSVIFLFTTVLLGTSSRLTQVGALARRTECRECSIARLDHPRGGACRRTESAAKLGAPMFATTKHAQEPGLPRARAERRGDGDDGHRGEPPRRRPRQPSHAITIAVDEFPPVLNDMTTTGNGEWTAMIAGPALARGYKLLPDFSYEPWIFDKDCTVSSPSPFTVDCTIRPDAKWSDNVPITSGDFKFTCRRS